MKRLFPLLVPVLVLAAGFSAQAADMVQITAAKKTGVARLSKAGEGDIAKGGEESSFDITVTNPAAKDTGPLTVKYVVFVERERIGEKKGNEIIERAPGEKTVEPIKARQKATVTTDPVKLMQSKLAGQYYFQGGGRVTAKDSIKGIWVRVFQGETMVGEMINPSTIKNRETFEKPGSSSQQPQ